MKLTIESTEEFVDVRGIAHRVWNGTSEKGVRCKVLVAMVRIDRDAMAAEFDESLIEITSRVRGR